MKNNCFSFSNWLILMVEWYVFAVLAPAFWALDNVFIKFLITNKFKSYYPTIAIISTADLIFALAISLFNPISVSFPFSLFALLVGFLPLISFWFYSQALLYEDVSRVVTLVQLIPVFVVFLSVIFLNEVLGVNQYLGIGLVVVAASLISYKKAGGKSFSRAAKFMVPFAFVIAIYTIVDKGLLGHMDFWSVFFWTVSGTFVGAMSMLVSSKRRRALVETVGSLRQKIFLVTFVGEGMYVTGTICSLVALSLVDAPLASAFSGLQPFFVFLYIIFLSLFLPTIMKEDISKTTIALKIAAILLMFIGTWLIL
jgi:drug/metabolite transporter (DMT)-like permease